MVDIHKYGSKLKCALQSIQSESRIPDADREFILEYIKKLESKGLNAGRVAKYAYYLKNIRLQLGVNFKDAAREDIEELVRKINAEDYTAWTKADQKGIIKRFYRWLRTGAMDSSAPFPPEVAWIKDTVKRNEKKEPDALTGNEAKAMVQAAVKLRDKAFIAVLYEGGFHIGEILIARLGAPFNYDFDLNINGPFSTELAIV